MYGYMTIHLDLDCLTGQEQVVTRLWLSTQVPADHVLALLDVHRQTYKPGNTL